MDRSTRNLFFKFVLIAVALGFSMLMGRMMWPDEGGLGTMPLGWGRGLGMGIGGLPHLAQCRPPMSTRRTHAYSETSAPLR